MTARESGCCQDGGTVRLRHESIAPTNARVRFSWLSPFHARTSMSNAGSEADDELPATRDSPRDVGRMDEDVPSTSTVSNYTTQLASRASLTASFRPSEAPRTFSLESVLTLPHATSVYALSLPAFGHHLFTGGSDGFIRRYNLHDSLNGIDSPRNLIMKQAGLSSGVLVGYWENSEAAIDTEEAPGPKFGPRSVSNSTTGGKAGGSPVHSLAVQSQELWGLSGTQVRPSANVSLHSWLTLGIERRDPPLYGATRRGTDPPYVARRGRCQSGTYEQGGRQRTLPL